METVTFNITKENYRPPVFDLDRIKARIKFLKKKSRIYGEIRLTGIRQYAHTYTVLPFYKPSPKSQLRIKSKFTKNKFKITL